jgi:hypothetical protein
MKGVRGCENQTKLKEPLPGVQRRLFENQGMYFIFLCRCVQTRTRASELKIKNEELRMKGVRGCENQTKLKEPLPGFNAGYLKIRKFISFFFAGACRHEGIRIKNEE